MTRGDESQTASAVLMVRPAGFRANPETAGSNAFQELPGEDTERSAREIQALAEREFDGLAAALEGAGVRVVRLAARGDGTTPDALFPNNWVSFHADGTVVLYPMMAPSRRRERREELLAELVTGAGFQVRRIIDLSAHERDGRFLEGTGSLVLDRVHRIAYACLSPRTDLEALADFGRRLDYETVAFNASDQGGIPVYHTNVMMSVGRDFAVVCEEAIGAAGQRDAVRRKLEETGHEVIPITLQQAAAFAGNLLELSSATGERIIALSTSAEACLEAGQRDLLAGRARFATAAIPTIEAKGGGSARCMLAELHLPPKPQREA